MTLEADANGCQEASPLSRAQYIPCNQLATHLVKTSDQALYRMCGICADHNVSNRNACVVSRLDRIIDDDDFHINRAIKAVNAVLKHYNIELSHDQSDTVVRSAWLALRSPSQHHISSALHHLRSNNLITGDPQLDGEKLVEHTLMNIFNEDIE